MVKILAGFAACMLVLIVVEEGLAFGKCPAASGCGPSQCGTKKCKCVLESGLYQCQEDNQVGYG